jgi:transcriptional regulator with XRE-family HTH domain
MRTLFLRLVSLVLVPCLIADPISAASFVSLNSTTVPGHPVVWQMHFNDQAFVEPLIGAYTYAADKLRPFQSVTKESAWVRATGAAYSYIPEIFTFTALVAGILPYLPLLAFQQQDPGSAAVGSAAGVLWAGSKLQYTKRIKSAIGNPPLSMKKAEELAPILIDLNEKDRKLNKSDLAEKYGVNKFAIGWLQKLIERLHLNKKTFQSESTTASVSKNLTAVKTTVSKAEGSKIPDIKTTAKDKTIAQPRIGRPTSKEGLKLRADLKKYEGKVSPKTVAEWAEKSGLAEFTVRRIMTEMQVATPESAAKESPNALKSAKSSTREKGKPKSVKAATPKPAPEKKSGTPQLDEKILRARLKELKSEISASESVAVEAQAAYEKNASVLQRMAEAVRSAMDKLNPSNQSKSIDEIINSVKKAKKDLDKEHPAALQMKKAQAQLDALHAEKKQIQKALELLARNYRTLEAKIKAIRTYSKLSQRELADKAELPQTTITRIERGRPVKEAEAISIGRVLGFDGKADYQKYYPVEPEETDPPPSLDLKSYGSFGELVITLRKYVGWTPEELAFAADVTLETVEKIEKGENPFEKRAIKVLMALGLSNATELYQSYFPVPPTTWERLLELVQDSVDAGLKTVPVSKLREISRDYKPFEKQAETKPAEQTLEKKTVERPTSQGFKEFIAWVDAHPKQTVSESAKDLVDKYGVTRGTVRKYTKKNKTKLTDGRGGNSKNFKRPKTAESKSDSKAYQNALDIATRARNSLEEQKSALAGISDSGILETLAAAEVEVKRLEEAAEKLKPATGDKVSRKPAKPAKSGRVAEDADIVAVLNLSWGDIRRTDLKSTAEFIALAQGEVTTPFLTVADARERMIQRGSETNPPVSPSDVEKILQAAAKIAQAHAKASAPKKNLAKTETIADSKPQEHSGTNKTNFDDSPSQAQTLDQAIRKAIAEDPDAAITKLSDMVNASGIKTNPMAVRRAIKRGIPYTKKPAFRKKDRLITQSSDAASPSAVVPQADGEKTVNVTAPESEDLVMEDSVSPAEALGEMTSSAQATSNAKRRGSRETEGAKNLRAYAAEHRGQEVPWSVSELRDQYDVGWATVYAAVKKYELKVPNKGSSKAKPAGTVALPMQADSVSSQEPPVSSELDENAPQASVHEPVPAEESQIDHPDASATPADASPAAVEVLSSEILIPLRDAMKKAADAFYVLQQTRAEAKVAKKKLTEFDPKKEDIARLGTESRLGNEPIEVLFKTGFAGYNTLVQVLPLLEKPEGLVQQNKARYAVAPVRALIKAYQEGNNYQKVLRELWTVLEKTGLTFEELKAATGLEDKQLDRFINGLAVDYPTLEILHARVIAMATQTLSKNLQPHAPQGKGTTLGAYATALTAAMTLFHFLYVFDHVSSLPLIFVPLSVLAGTLAVVGVVVGLPRLVRRVTPIVIPHKLPQISVDSAA